MPIPSVVADTQDRIVGAVKSVNDRLPALPLADRLPTDRLDAFVERAFAAAADVLENQRQFTVRLLDALAAKNPAS